MTPIDRLARIERKRLALLGELSALDEAAVTAHPLPGKWSIREIIEHLVLAEEGVVGDFSRLDALEGGADGQAPEPGVRHDQAGVQRHVGV